MQETGIIDFPINEVYDRVQLILSYIPKINHFTLQFQEDIKKGRIIKNFYELVKLSDQEVENQLLDIIQKNFKKDSIISESAGEIQKDGDFSWWLDPLDGSRNFIHNNPFFCISIGLVFRDNPVAGIVTVPFFNEIYHAIYGEGAYKNKKRIMVSTTTSLDLALISSGIPFNRQEILHQLLTDLSTMISAGTGIRKTGSIVIDLCWTAEGRIDGMWERNLNPWDTCAGYIILKEAGGKITDIEGNSYHIQIDNLVASNSLIHSDIIHTLRNIKEGDFN